MVAFPSKEGWPGGDISTPCTIRPPARTCSRCREPQKAAIARYCARCGFRLPPAHPSNALAYTEATLRGRRLRDLGFGWTRLAIRSFREALACQPDSIEPLLEIAETYLRAGRRRRARRWYRRIILRRPDCFEAWRKGAECFWRHAHFRRARWLLKAYALRPGDMGVLNDLTCHLANLSGWRRWWICHRLWRTYDSTWPGVLPGSPQERWKLSWLLPLADVSQEWETVLQEWALNKRTGVVPFTRKTRFLHMAHLDQPWAC